MRSLVAGTLIMAALLPIGEGAHAKRSRVSSSRRAVASRAPKLPPGIEVRVTLEEGKLVPGALVTLRLHITQRGRWRGGVYLDLETPEGATVVRGPLAMRLVPDSNGGSRSVDLKVQLDRVPPGDLIAVAHAAGGWDDFQTVSRYRFGRPEPAVSASMEGATNAAVAAEQ